MIWRLLLKRSLLRLSLGLLLVLSLPLWLPESLQQRLWILSFLGLLSPWLVLGRDQARRREGWRALLQRAPRARRLILGEQLLPLLILALGAWLGTEQAWRPSLALLSWSGCLMLWADALDRSSSDPGTAWLPLSLGIILIVGAPLWLSPLFGLPAWRPWIATLAVGLHPAASALAAAQLSTLQDPWFYTLTLSGILEVRPLDWSWGFIFYSGLGFLGLLSAQGAARRP